MSVFKKIASFFFEEEEELSEEAELETIVFRDEPKKVKPAPIKEKEVIRTEVSNPTPVQERKVQASPQEEKKFVDIKVSEQAKPVVDNRRVVPTVRKKIEPVKTSEYEFTPVISPIFGASESSKKVVKTPTVPQNQPTIATTSKKKNPLGTIISPIYGATELEEFEAEAKERIETQERKAKENIVLEEVENDDDVINVPLEDLLASDEIVENSDDLLQYSLFGDDEIIQEEKEKSPYTIVE